MNTKVVVNDVGPRDGLQNHAKHLTVPERLELISALAKAGLKNIEIGAFVSPKVVPQMAGSDSVAAELSGTSDINYSALVPNLKGYQLARMAGVKNVVMVVYGSDTMAQKNVGFSREQANQQTEQILAVAKDQGVGVIATIGVAFSCPFDGATNPDVICRTGEQLLNAGANRFVVADTIGAASPAMVASLMQRLLREFGPEKLGCHFHDTRALGLANIYAAVEAGVRYFDASIAGLGSCPFAPGASGNVATEDVVMLLKSLGYDSGIDLKQLLQASDVASRLTGNAPGGRAKAWMQSQLAAGYGL